MRTCHQDPTHTFVVTEDDLVFYDKISPVFAGKKYQVSPPTLCPLCRQQRRLVFRNTSKLYHRKSDFSGKQIISIHSQDKPYKAYTPEEWWSDAWDPRDYGRDFDFSKTLAEQLHALYLDVPHVSLHNRNTENSSYTNFALNQKNCYLIFGGSNDEDCLYGNFIVSCKDCVDNLSLFSSELCYEGVASEGCYSCRFFTHARNCTDCTMIENCQSCKNCIGCFGLQGKEYYMFNTYVGKEKYKEYSQEYIYLTPEKIVQLRKKLQEIKVRSPHIESRIFASENCTGDNIFHCSNCLYAFDTKDCENCTYIYFTPRANNSQDCTFNAPDGVAWCYNVASTVSAHQSMVTFFVWYGSNIYYSIECHNSANLFGCVGMKRNEYCILNKQYAQDEYERMVGRIIEHMQKTGEWGEYFPYSLSPFGYNETIAMDYFPLEKKEAIALGMGWHDEMQEAEYYGEDIRVPEDIRDVSDNICEKVLRCKVTQKYYKITPQEFRFYQKMKLPVPTRCPDQRHLDRIALRNPQRFWQRSCDMCGKNVETTYAPNKAKIVYCRECYLKDM